MSLFAIADLHFSFGTNKPMNVFRGWNDYVNKLEKNWHAIISDNDTVVISGDISWALKLQDTEEDFKFLNSLPGKKILLKGNHDYWWGTKKKIDDYLKGKHFDTLSILFNNAYAVENFAVCGSRGWSYESDSEQDIKILNREVNRLNTSILQAKKFYLEPIVFLHYPPVYLNIECKEIMDVLLFHNIKKCYYGHLHGSNSHKRAVIGDYRGINFKLISCDYLDFLPILVI